MVCLQWASWYGKAVSVSSVHRLWRRSAPLPDVATRASSAGYWSNHHQTIMKVDDVNR